MTKIVSLHFIENGVNHEDSFKFASDFTEQAQ